MADLGLNFPVTWSYYYEHFGANESSKRPSKSSCLGLFELGFCRLQPKECSENGDLFTKEKEVMFSLLTHFYSQTVTEIHFMGLEGISSRWASLTQDSQFHRPRLHQPDSLFLENLDEVEIKTDWVDVESYQWEH